MSPRDALTALLPPPAAPACAVPGDAWPGIEERLGVALPGDYKWFMGRYGYGQIDDFLIVFSPLAPVRWSDIFHHALEDPEGWAILSRKFPCTFPDSRFPAEGGLLPFARSDNGDCFYWNTAGPADAWTTTVIDMRYPDGRYDHAGGMVELLAALLGRTAPAEIVTDEWPSAEPRFRPIRRD